MAALRRLSYQDLDCYHDLPQDFLMHAFNITRYGFELLTYIKSDILILGEAVSYIDARASVVLILEKHVHISRLYEVHVHYPCKATAWRSSHDTQSTFVSYHILFIVPYSRDC